MKLEINMPKAFSITSLLFAIASGYYFLGAGIFQAMAFAALASILDSAGIGRGARNRKNWAPPLKNALDRCADAAIFVGFALSGIVSFKAGAIALVLVIMLPYWIKKIWKLNIRRFFHAALIARCIYFLAYGT